MSATVLDGRAMARQMQAEIDEEVRAFVAAHGFVPTLAVVRAGEDPASVSYARAIVSTFEKRGLKAVVHALPADVAPEEMVTLVARLSDDPQVHGIMVQEPYPPGVEAEAVLNALDPGKDVDGVHPANAGRLAQAEPVGRGPERETFFVPATPAGGMELLRRYGVQVASRHAVVVGRSNIVGKPMALLLLRENATVTICHSRTADLPGICRQADILAAAVGRPRMIRGDWIKPGAVVIDFGVNFVKTCPACGRDSPERAEVCSGCGGSLAEVEATMVGDVHYAEAVEVAGMITPVPGGTGPMTNVMLMRNLLRAAAQR
ncbi:MAG: bifunctional 5,10-methylenetetrahydrofolate dehydrogenase/5,10-methenyltetrahydrofolate cyclohydrolase [Chloroflexia bacterium]